MELNLKSEKLKNNLDGLLNGRANWLLFFIGNEKGSLLNKKRKIEGFIEKQDTVELNLVKFIIHMSLKSKQFIPGTNYHTINNNNKQQREDIGILNKRIKSIEEKQQQRHNTNLNHQQQDKKLIDLAINASKIQPNEIIPLTSINTSNKLVNKNNSEIKVKVTPSMYSKKRIYAIYNQLVCGRCNQFLSQSKKINPQFEDSLLPDLSDGFYCTCGGIISLSKLEQ
ncbi:hypothetical protein K502DRAFT_331206 [Neoconidiobolus thromboides FSU 785]|nr:hypothetical protein K502DRAFT_331206 [Neoconidiobolus thromboides FSU 785]